MPLQCFECGEFSETRKSLKQHIAVDHLAWLPYQCTYCVTYKVSKCDIRDHLQSRHAGHVEAFICRPNDDKKQRLEHLLTQSQEGKAAVRQSPFSYHHTVSPHQNQDHQNTPSSMSIDITPTFLKLENTSRPTERPSSEMDVQITDVGGGGLTTPDGVERWYTSNQASPATTPSLSAGRPKTGWGKKTKAQRPTAGNHIKRPLNGFFLWTQMERRKSCHQTSRMTNPELLKLLGKQWQGMTPEEKAPFMAEARQLKLLHQQQHPDYAYRPRPYKHKRQRKSTSQEHATPPDSCYSV